MKHLLFLLLSAISFMSINAQNSWEVPTQLADSLDLLMEFDAAVPYREEALQRGVNAPDSVQTMLEGLALFTRAELAFSETRRADSSAYAMMQQAVDSLLAAPAGPERISKAYWDLNMAAFNYMRNQQDTEKFLNKSIEYHLKSPEIDTLFLLNTMHGSGYMGILSGNYETAIATMKEALKLFEQYEVRDENNYKLQGYFYYNLAVVHSSNFLDIPQKQRMYLEKAVAVFESMEEPDYDYYLGALTDLSTNHRNHRNYSKALGYLNKAIQEYETNKERIYSEAMHHLGIKKELEFSHSLIILHRNKGDEAAMLETFEQVETLVANTDTDVTEMGMFKSIIESVVRYYTIHQPQPELAEHYIQKGLALQTGSSAIFRNNGSVVLMINRARVLMHQKEYSKALVLLEEIVQSDLTIGKKVILNELTALNHLGLKQPEEASLAINHLLVNLSEDNAQFVFPESTASDFHPGGVLGDAEALVRLAQAWHAYKGGFSSEEEQLYRLAMHQFEHALGKHTLNKGLKEAYDLIVSGLLEAALARPFSKAESNELLSFIETVKSKSLINSFLLNRELAGNSELYQLVEQEQLIRSQLTRLKKKLQQEEEEALQQQLFDKNLELEAVQQQLTDSYQEFNDFTTTDFSLEDYKGGSTVQFIVANGQLYKLRIHNKDVSFDKISGFPELKETLTTFVKDISNPDVALNEIQSRGEFLYEQLFPEGIESDGTLTLIPDGILHYLPFELLIKDGRYLIEDLAIAYAPNLTFVNINTLKNSRARSASAVYFAPEYLAPVSNNQLAVRGAPYALPGALEEVNELSQLVSGKLYTGTAASKQQFKSLDTDVAILHLAMHSNLNDEDPELSSLLFTDSETDYEMYISELYGLNFDSDLAVLSACNTGVGGIQDGGGLVSFQNAFTLAGIPATVASLWSAPDQATKELMVSFYKHLKNGHSKSKSLQLAKLDYLKNSPTTELQHPFYWAGFVLSGNDQPVEFATPFWQQALITGSAVALGTLIWVVYRKRRRG